MSSPSMPPYRLKSAMQGTPPPEKVRSQGEGRDLPQEFTASHRCTPLKDPSPRNMWSGDVSEPAKSGPSERIAEPPGIRRIRRNARMPPDREDAGRSTSEPTRSSPQRPGGKREDGWEGDEASSESSGAGHPVAECGKCAARS